MADSFFELKNSLNDIEEQYGELEEDEYDALNDETFGDDAVVEEDDWEDTHTLLAAATESIRAREVDQAVERKDDAFQLKSLSGLLNYNNHHVHEKPAGNSSPSPWPPQYAEAPPMPSRPQQMQRIPTVEELERKIFESNKEPVSPRPILNNATPPRANRQPSVQQHQRSVHQSSYNLPPGLHAAGGNRIPNHPLGPFGNAYRPPGFPPPGLHSGIGNAPRGRPHPHPTALPGRPGMGGMFPGHLPPHLAHQPHQHMMLRYPLVMPGVPMMPSQRMGPQPPPGLFHPLNHESDMPFGFEGHLRNNMHPPPHPILNPQPKPYNKQIQMNHLNWQQKQLINKFNGNEEVDEENGERDPYAKLMSNRDRIWLLNIQMMQLATDKPHIDDYYYTMWKKMHPTPRKLEVLRNGFHKDHKRPEAFFANNRPSERELQQRERRDSESTTATNASPRVYVPLQFENSLGKLQAKSVIAPRQVFDIDLVADSQGTQPVVPQKDHRKTKKILLELERLYLIQLEAEEFDSPEMADVERESDVTKEELINRVLNGLLNEERYLSFLCIRKGKTLLIRCLKHVTDYSSPLFIELWSRLLKAFPSVLRRDRSDALLPKLYPFFKSWTSEVSWSGLLTVAKSVLCGTRDGRTSAMRASPSPSKPVLVYILSNQFGLSAVTRLLLRGEEMVEYVGDISEWKLFVEELTKSMGNLESMDGVRPIEPIPTNILSTILEQRCSNVSLHLHATAKRVLGS